MRWRCVPTHSGTSRVEYGCEQRNASDGELKNCRRKVTHHHHDHDGDRYYCTKHAKWCPDCRFVIFSDGRLD